MWKLGISTEEEFLSETNIGLFSSSKSKFRDLDQEIWLGETPGKSTLVWPRAWKTLNTKTDKFWYSHYIPRLEKYQKLKISGAEDETMMNIFSKNHPPIRYIIGDMIPPS